MFEQVAECMGHKHPGGMLQNRSSIARCARRQASNLLLLVGSQVPPLGPVFVQPQLVHLLAQRRRFQEVLWRQGWRFILCIA